MTTLLESPITIALMGLVVSAVLAGGWLKTADRRLAIGFGLSILVTIGLLVLERMVVTDREQVTRVIYSVAQEVRAGNYEAAVEHMAPDAASEKQKALGELRHFTVSDVTIKQPIEIDLNSKKAPTSATARFNVVVTGGDSGGVISDQRVPRFLEVKFIKQDGRWWVDSYEHFEPFHGMRSGEGP